MSSSMYMFSLTDRGRGGSSSESNLSQTTVGTISNFSSLSLVAVGVAIGAAALRRRFIGLPRFLLADRGTYTLG